MTHADLICMTYYFSQVKREGLVGTTVCEIGINSHIIAIH